MDWSNTRKTAAYLVSLDFNSGLDNSLYYSCYFFPSAVDVSWSWQQIQLLFVMQWSDL